MENLIDRLRNLRKKKCLAFVLGSGGARGAFQVGALQALCKAGLQPDLLVGTSIGAANAAFVAVNGFTEPSIQALKDVWRDAASADLLPANYLWLTVRGLFGRRGENPGHRMREFFTSHSLSPDMRFSDMKAPRLILISADLNAGGIVRHGLDPDERVLDALLASAALPPWVSPIHRDNRYLIDGGFLSSLPVEPALAAGATEIIALDLSNPVDPAHLPPGFGPFIEKLVTAVELRQAEVELALAAARRIPTLHIRFEWPAFLPPWDFQYTQELIEIGYLQTRQRLNKR